MIDVVQPYITTHPHGVVRRHDISVPVFVRWAVRGCFEVDGSRLLWGLWPSEAEVKSFQPNATNTHVWQNFIMGEVSGRRIGMGHGWPPANIEAAIDDLDMGQAESASRSLDARDYDLFDANFSRGDEFAAFLPKLPQPGATEFGVVCFFAVSPLTVALYL